ncbi:hypothetical protein [Chitinimonas koreensis]|uniref:hypothetical protein n=1 Tax=Chitinimonas koreensis TaxID=356302 RepID=UPI000413DA42|nr:hypothetical protein [Chitinimonas koreensis]QNM96059.1 hypothetical protein H9L41_19930 [Chitinimonas koreensis]
MQSTQRAAVVGIVCGLFGLGAGSCFGIGQLPQPCDPALLLRSAGGLVLLAGLCGSLGGALFAWLGPRAPR